MEGVNIQFSGEHPEIRRLQTAGLPEGGDFCCSDCGAFFAEEDMIFVPMEPKRFLCIDCAEAVFDGLSVREKARLCGMQSVDPEEWIERRRRLWD